MKPKFFVCIVLVLFLKVININAQNLNLAICKQDQTSSPQVEDVEEVSSSWTDDLLETELIEMIQVDTLSPERHERVIEALVDRHLACSSIQQLYELDLYQAWLEGHFERAVQGNKWYIEIVDNLHSQAHLIAWWLGETCPDNGGIDHTVVFAKKIFATFKWFHGLKNIYDEQTLKRYQHTRYLFVTEVLSKQEQKWRSLQNEIIDACVINYEEQALIDILCYQLVPEVRQQIEEVLINQKLHKSEYFQLIEQQPGFRLEIFKASLKHNVCWTDEEMLKLLRLQPIEVDMAWQLIASEAANALQEIHTNFSREDSLHIAFNHTLTDSLSAQFYSASLLQTAGFYKSRDIATRLITARELRERIITDLFAMGQGNGEELDAQSVYWELLQLDLEHQKRLLLKEQVMFTAKKERGEERAHQLFSESLKSLIKKHKRFDRSPRENFREALEMAVLPLPGPGYEEN